MKRTREQKGITLIALIITIVVLLILAVVTINAVRGDGIIGYAKKATDDYGTQSEAEKKTLEDYLSLIESSIIGGNNIISGGNNTTPGFLPEEIVDTRQEYTIGEIRTENGTINGKVYSSNNPIIPAGFQPKNTETSLWDAADGPEVDNGLVITDGTNEFVWVPVTSEIAAYNVETTDYIKPDGTTDYREPDVVIDFDNDSANLNIINNILGTNYQNSDEFKTALTDEFNSMATSANTYGGFYVGRYEMSLASDKTAQSKYGEISSNAEDTDTNTWYGLYARAKTYTKASVQSSMIWGSQYDAMMSWMGEAANTTIGDSKNKTRYTGVVETDKIKNVYDLYGNSLEWTLEAGVLYDRVGRGGSCSLDSAASLRNNYVYPNCAFNDHSSRLALYIV